MKHILFGSNIENLKVAIAIKASALNKAKLTRYYIDPVESLEAENFVAYDLAYNGKKAPVSLIRECLSELLPEIDERGINTLLVCDAPYFKTLTKNKKADPFYGYACPCAIEGYEHLQIVLCPSHQILMYNPLMQEKIDRALEALETTVMGNYEDPGQDIIKEAHYPRKLEDIKRTLDALHKFPELTCDIEGKSLEFWTCGISTIAFAWDKHRGVAFSVDRAMGADEQPLAHRKKDNPYVPSHRPVAESAAIKAMLKEFFQTYKGKLIYHNIAFDGKVLAYELWMEHLADSPNRIAGIKEMTKNFDDTKLILYQATNNAVKNELGLKAASAEFTGNYAEDVTDTEKIPLPNLLEYNLKDCMATWYVKEKYEPIMIADEQQELYETLLKDAVVTLMDTELCGMPINPAKVQVAKKVMTDIETECMDFFKNNPIIQKFHHQALQAKADKKTAEAKAKAKTDRPTKVYCITDSVIYEEFNPNSGPQLQTLLYDYLGYPVLDLTKSKQPATGGKTIKKLLNHSACEEHTEIFEYIIKLADVAIILSTFIPAFENAQQLPDGSWRLFGNFNLGGTQSLRLSSSNPNLQNIPSGSIYAKIIKECFEAPPGWLFCGSDFDALEDKVGSLRTQDPEKLKIYIEGFCGHCVRALSYWPEKMPDIDPTSPDSVNSIKKKYKVYRQDSKAPSFALQYDGTFKTLMTNCGFSEGEAKRIEANYHSLYVVSDEHMKAVIEKAKELGYVPLAFGARVRTPLLAKTIGTGKSVPYAAMAEARSAGNAYIQSYCFLTVKAFSEFRKRLWASKYVHDILPSATIHDAIYYLVRNSAKIMEWFNRNLIECMAWNELPELQHDVVKISSGLEIFWPSWRDAIDVPNGATSNEIMEASIAFGKEFTEAIHYDSGEVLEMPKGLLHKTTCARYMTASANLTIDKSLVTCKECAKKLNQ